MEQMGSDTAASGGSNPELIQEPMSKLEGSANEGKHTNLADYIETKPHDLVYDDDEREPELHARTYFALAAMFILNLVQVVALQGPPAVVCTILGLRL